MQIQITYCTLWLLEQNSISKVMFFRVARILGNSLQLSIRIVNNTGRLYFLPSHTAWLSNGNSNMDGWVLSNPQQAEIQYHLLCEIRYVQHEVVNIDILCKLVEHTTVKRTSLCHFMKLLKGLEKNWIYICSRVHF